MFYLATLLAVLKCLISTSAIVPDLRTNSLKYSSVTPIQVVARWTRDAQKPSLVPTLLLEYITKQANLFYLFHDGVMASISASHELPCNLGVPEIRVRSPVLESCSLFAFFFI
jgi:surface polysaccharide O-acyltransferase-like enzyme